jgi:branched-chain amino acid transport system ATP-binding protein
MIQTHNSPLAAAGATGPLLSAKNLSVRFGGVLAVNNVSFDVQRGEVFTLIGPNGAGKTTVFNLISRIYTPTTGEIEYEGKVLTEQPPHKIASLGIARTFQNIELFEHATVLHNLLIGRHTHRTTGLWSDLFFTGKARQAEIEAREKCERVIEFLDLQKHRDSMVAGLPYGVRKVVELARALCTEPKLLLLDEPSSGLNVEETEDMAFWIQDIKHELGITVLMVEHDMTLVSKVSDRVLAMNQGEVLAMGSPREVQNHPGVIEAYLGSVDDMSSLRRELSGDGPPLGAKAPSGGSAAASAANVGAR